MRAARAHVENIVRSRRMDGDRERWNARWRERAADLEDASAFLVDHAGLIGPPGKALDLAGGAGRNAIWLARRGHEVTLVDVSDVALDKAEQRARRLGVASRMRFLQVDAEGPLPLAPLFDLAVVVHYLDRDRRDALADLLVMGGLLFAANATVTNLERHARPSHHYLLEPAEQRRWVTDLGFEVLAEREEWTIEGTHEAAILARKRARIRPTESEPERGPSTGPYR
jgi:tellurite methyltransferase